MNKEKCYSYIRFSSKRQEYGDSERRQSQRAEEYARNNNLKLDHSFDFLDRGLSGFTGENITAGNLGLFLKLVEEGKIASGSRLIVESVDRLGRQQPFEAIDLIRKLLASGIMLVVIDWYEPKEYTYESIQRNPGEFSGLGREIERAFFESLKKSERISASRKSERELAQTGVSKANFHPPMWISKVVKLNDDTKTKEVSFEIIPHIAAAINRIFVLKLEGLGNKKIANKLNDDPEGWKPDSSVRNKSGGWATSTIQRYIHDRRLIGECQFYKKVDGKRVKEGDVITDYFDPVVSKELFYEVQASIKRISREHGLKRGGGKHSNNILTGIAKCGHCGSSIGYFDPGKNNGNPKLQCVASRERSRYKHIVCKAKPFQYSHFISNFFKYTTELKASDIIEQPDQLLKEISIIDTKLDINAERISDFDSKSEQLIKGTKLDGTDKFTLELLIKEISEIGKEREKFITSNKELIQRRLELSSQTKEIKQSLSTLTEMWSLLQSAKTGEEGVEIREKIRGAISQLVDRIEIYSSNKQTNHYYRVMIKFKGYDPYLRGINLINGLWNSRTRKPPKSIM